MRKPIQGWSLAGEDQAVATFVICDDGSIWVFTAHASKWEKYPPIPQDGE